VAAATVLALGWRPLFLVLGAGALGLALVSLRTGLPRTARPSPGGLSVRAAGCELLGALRRPLVLRWLLLLEASDLLLDVLLGFLALYLVDEAGLSGVGAALAVSMTLGAGLAGNVALLPLVARVGALRYLRASALGGGALFAGALLAPAAAKVPLLVALSFVTAGWYPVLKARLYRALPGRSGTAMALGSLAGLLGALPPLALGALAARYGLGTALWLLLPAPVALLALVPRRDSTG
jgi:MFS transporter, FSR family, fosmidomycin resistance protein